MAATKDQRRLLNKCVLNDIPVFVLTGTDRCAMAALKAYAEEAQKMGCTEEFLNDLNTNVIPDFKDFQEQESEMVKLPD